MDKVTRALRAKTTRELAKSLNINHDSVMDAFIVISKEISSLDDNVSKFYKPMFVTDMDGIYAKEMPMLFVYKVIDELLKDGTLKSI